MEWVIGAVIAVAATITTWIVFRTTVYRRLFSEGHFAEVAQGIGEIKAAAIERVVSPNAAELTPLDDKRVMVTRHGLVFFYSIRRVEDLFIHHFSVSIGGGYTAHAVGASFVFFVTKLLEIPFELLSLGVAPSTVHHAEFELTPVEQSEFASRPIRKLQLSEITAFRLEAYQAGRSIRWERLDVRPISS